jgi:hypothetical protein
MMTIESTSSRTSGRHRNASRALVDALETAPKDKETVAMRASIHVPARPLSPLEEPTASQSLRRTHSQFEQTIDVRKSDKCQGLFLLSSYY